MNYAKASFLKDVSMTLNLEGYDRNVNITGNTIQDILMSYGRSACPNLKSFYKKASNSNKTVTYLIYSYLHILYGYGMTALRFHYLNQKKGSKCMLMELYLL